MGPALITDPSVLLGYLRDASNTEGHADGLLRPNNAQEVAAILRDCQAAGRPVTVTAQRTSTTGGPVPEGGWLLSTERLSRVHTLGPDHAVAEGGVLLGELQREIEATGRFYPPDPTSKDECSLGGSIACNASGARTFRYGPTRPWVEAVKVVLPTGELLTATRDTPIPTSWPRLDWREPKVKTAAGLYPADNLLDLIIGSEGILGVITEATVRLTALPKRVFSILIPFPSAEAGLSFVMRHRRRGPLSPRLMEWFDSHSLDMVRARVPDLPADAQAALWCEQEATEEDADALMEAWLEALEESGAMMHAVIFAEDPSSLERLRLFRHALPAAVNERVAHNGMPKVGTDFAVPDSALPEMMAAYAEVTLPHVLFGHIGDNHLHLNLFPRSPDELVAARAVWAALFRKAISLGGTVSAEHGVGKLKRRFLAEMVGPEVLSSFVALKRHVDPAWILGRGTMLEIPESS
ncbi:MAG: FAD-binding oxidoreductase [Deltaproteobacteria bacterium]|nr:FAD-binding oxidoreductase [Deltaproteobacteria bacterium]